MIKKAALTALVLFGLASGGCLKVVAPLAKHEIRMANGETNDVVWIVRDRDAVYRCALYNKRPYCVKATFGKLP